MKTRMRSVILSALALLMTASGPAPALAGEMVLIKGGSFTMGSPESEVRREKDETPHRVTVGDFYLNRYEVTQNEYQ